MNLIFILEDEDTERELLNKHNVQLDGLRIKDIENPSEAVQLAAVEDNANAIKYILNPSETVKLAAVKSSGIAIQFIKNPSEAVQLAAVQQDGYAIYYIKNPSETVQLAAVQNAGFVIQCIEKPSEQVRLAAVASTPWAIKHINNPSDLVKLAAIRSGISKNVLEIIDVIENPTKDMVIIFILGLLKATLGEEYNRPTYLYYSHLCKKYFTKFKSEYPDWPEWTVIEKSLRSSKMIKENDDLL